MSTPYNVYKQQGGDFVHVGRIDVKDRKNAFDEARRKFKGIRWPILHRLVEDRRGDLVEIGSLGT